MTNKIKLGNSYSLFIKARDEFVKFRAEWKYMVRNLTTPKAPS
ncbi:MAG: hypothetical protein ACI8R9_002570 [Paraglaciecola sp.]|jgi:hypothetical protein